MKKKNKKILKLVTVCLVLVSIMPIVGSEDTELVGLDYQDTELVFVPGDVTLVFNDSDTGDDDISVLWRIYNSDNNITIFYLASKTITYDASFVNDTKTYSYNGSDGKKYIVLVNYSSIEVPTSIEDILNATIALQHATIIKLQQNYTNLTIQYNTLVKERDDWKAQAGVLKIQRDDAISQNTPLKAEIDNLEEQISFQQNKTKELNEEVSYKENIIESLENTIAQLRNPWATGYEYEGESNGFFFNYTSLIIGIIIALIVFVGVEKLMEKKGLKINWNKKRTLGALQPKQSKAFSDAPPLTDHPTLAKMREKEKAKIEGSHIDKKPTKAEIIPDVFDIEKQIDEIITKRNREGIDYIG